MAFAPLDSIETGRSAGTSPPGLCVSRRVEGSLPDQTPGTVTRYAISNHERLPRIACGLSVIAILIAKIPLIWRININWDEFYFLSHVHSLARGDLHLLLQGAYTHLFVWVTRLDADEIGQIGLLRLTMWPFLALSCFLLYRLARRWASATGAWLATFVFVASWPVLKHGISFRADSLLLPLTLAAFLLASTNDRRARWRDIGTGVFIGLALALTIKAALLLPALMAMLFLERLRDRDGTDWSGFIFLRRLVLIAGATGLTTALILAAHANFVTSEAERPELLAAHALSSALLDVPWAPRWNYFQQLLANDSPIWFLLGAGLVVAVARKLYGAAACVSSLLPVLFYRNAFPYYYVVMLAPACVVVALAADEIRAIAARSGRALAGTGAISIFFLLVAHDAWDHLMTLRFDEQAAQRSVISAVHRIFPTAVPYIDHSGMISSFPKVNFFMSAWGIESYLARGEDFMPEILAAHRPPLLLANHGALIPGSLLFRRLRKVDQSLIRDSYVDYWGPVRIAGTELVVPSGGVVLARLPFAGLYRIESDVAILIGGKRHAPGERIEWHADSQDLPIQAVAPDSPPIRIRIVWDAARDPPKDPPPAAELYSGP